jgi:hypothetical protein
MKKSKKLTSIALNRNTGDLWESTRPYTTTRDRFSVKNYFTGKWYQYAGSSLRFLTSAELDLVLMAKQILHQKKRKSSEDKAILSEYNLLLG